MTPSLSCTVDEDDASTKLTKAQCSMQASKEYGSATFGVVDICWSFRSSPILQKSSSTPLETPAKDKLFIIVSSDKGLCGGIHSSLVTKVTRHVLADLEQADLSRIDRFSLGPIEEGSKRGRDGSRGGRGSS